MVYFSFDRHGFSRATEYRCVPLSSGTPSQNLPPQGVILNVLAVYALEVVASLVLVALNGLFVAAEFALVKIRATQVDRLVKEGRPFARLVKEANDRLDAYLAVCQVGITICSVGLGALGEPAVSALIEPLLRPLELSTGLVHLISFALGFLIVTFLVVVFGELAPKTFSIQKAEATALFTAAPMKLFYFIFRPLVVTFNGTANAVTSLLGVPPASEGEETYTEDELRTLVAQSTRQGMLERDEEEMVGAIFELNDKVAREIMVPRPDVVALPASMDLKNLVSVAATGHYTRYPVFEEDSPERVIGMIHAKDVLRAVEAAGGLQSEATARDMLRDVLVVPENRHIDDILEDFQNKELQMGVVIDEWGSFEGVFTVEDIIEEIVGEIRDEFDEEEPAVRQLPNGSFTIDGRIPISVVNEALGAHFESDDFDTIGGLVLGQLGRPPEVGDEVRLDGHLLRVDDTDGARVAQVLAQAAKNGSEPPEILPA